MIIYKAVSWIKLEVHFFMKNLMFNVIFLLRGMTWSACVYVSVDRIFSSVTQIGMFF